MDIFVTVAGTIVLVARIILFGPSPTDLIDAILLTFGCFVYYSLREQLNVTRDLYQGFMQDLGKSQQRCNFLQEAISTFERLNSNA